MLSMTPPRRAVGESTSRVALTPLDAVRRGMEVLAPGARPVVLYVPGRFCPPRRDHLAAVDRCGRCPSALPFKLPLLHTY